MTKKTNITGGDSSPQIMNEKKSNLSRPRGDEEAQHARFMHLRLMLPARKKKKHS